MLLKFAVQEFLSDREFKNVTKNSITTSKFHLEEMKSFFTDKGIVNVEDISPGLVKQYLLYCKNVRKNNPTTINSKIKRLKAFFNYMIEIHVIKENPFAKIPLLKEDIKIEAFTDEHIKQMLGYFRKLKTREKTYHAYRDYMIIVLLLGTGARVGEIANLKWSDVDFINSNMTLFGKNRETSSIPIASKLFAELAEYKVFVDQLFKERPSAVLATADGEPMTANAIKCVIKRLKSIMNFSDVRLSSHTFRHTFAKRYLLGGGDIASLQRLLRHEDPRMTLRYAKMWGTALKEQNEKFNPINNLEL